VNFLDSEDENDSVRRDNEQARDEETQEYRNPSRHVAISASIIVASRSSHSTHDDRGDDPRGDVVDELEALSVPVPAHDHLVEVERDAEGPDEVGEEEVVEDHRGGDAHDGVFEVEGEEEEKLREEDAHAQINH